MKWRGGGFDNLRKFGKEVGQTARRRKRVTGKIVPDPQCARCGYKLSSHVTHQYLSEGMCDDFLEANRG